MSLLTICVVFQFKNPAQRHAEAIGNPTGTDSLLVTNGLDGVELSGLHRRVDAK